MFYVKQRPWWTLPRQRFLLLSYIDEARMRITKYRANTKASELCLDRRFLLLSSFDETRMRITIKPSELLRQKMTNSTAAFWLSSCYDFRWSIYS